MPPGCVVLQLAIFICTFGLRRLFCDVPVIILFSSVLLVSFVLSCYLCSAQLYPVSVFCLLCKFFARMLRKTACFAEVGMVPSSRLLHNAILRSVGSPRHGRSSSCYCLRYILTSKAKCFRREYYCRYSIVLPFECSLLVLFHAHQDVHVPLNYQLPDGTLVKKSLAR
ncbi:hypothetical protein J3A83DRAFT_1037000 [Scleroderma citrinum]